jgi:ABC-type multidrug transport system fused ATPase/permease subunit
MSGLHEVLRLVLTEADPFVRRRLALALGLVTLASVLTGLGPVALKTVVDRLAVGIRGAGESTVLWIGFYVFTQFLARSLNEVRALVYSRAERRMARTLTERLFGHVMRLPLRYHWERQTGGLTQGMANGVEGYQLILHTMMFSFLPVVTELATIVLVLSRLGQPAFLALFCAAIACYAVAFTFAARRTRKAARTASAAQVEATGAMTDGILAYETVKYFAAEREVERRVWGALKRTENEWVRFYRQYAINGLLIAAIYAGFLLATNLYAAKQVSLGNLTIGTLFLVNAYMLQIVRPVESFGYAMQSLSQGLAYLDKTLELLREQTELEVHKGHDSDSPERARSKSASAAECVELQPASENQSQLAASTRHRGDREGQGEAYGLRKIQGVPEGDKTQSGSDTSGSFTTIPGPMFSEEPKPPLSVPLFRGQHSAAEMTVGTFGPHGDRDGVADLGTEPTTRMGELEFRDVCLSYRAGVRVLDGVSFKIPSGRTLGIVGASGSGKSTLVRLLTRLIEPDEGEVLLDGVPVGILSLTALRGAIAVVPQVTDLFNDTIGYNIGFGRAGSARGEIEDAARLAHLHEFIVSLPEGYDTRVGERGVKLSGGERQRVSIARAALKRPRVYVFDEATSSLDTTTEREISRNLDEISRHSTTLVIAHRLSTVVHSDEIVVLDAGVVAERGTHDTLMSKGGRYAALWRAQHHGAAAA